MLTIEQLIKLLTGLAVFVAVVGGIYLFFRYDVIDFFKNLVGNETAQETILGLIR